ncbi:YesK family protein [Bacillus swezeyi]|uniref:YesK-like protein n=1 Tax=Bacillus swezeyi TaxID=1925020 RepID=A0A5M8RZJ3_9BACI|nr:YesK family protein [Bacillus swezeyi]KAA6452743.1 hypothetical protein DX927_00510 [Bacillus swezeyi]TYS38108.1 hypothetical protein FZC77_00445 [Bacillus swezeyi]
MSYWLMTAILTVIITGISLIFNKKKSPLQYGIPSIFMLGSFVLLIISFFVGGWEGMGIGAISVSLLIASIIALIVMSLSVFLKGD